MSKYLSVKYLLISKQTGTQVELFKKLIFEGSIWGVPGGWHPQTMSKYLSVKYLLISKKVEPEMTSFLRLSEASKEFQTVLSTIHAYQCAYCIHCTAYSLLTTIFSWSKIFYLLSNALHHYCAVDDVIIQKH